MKKILFISFPVSGHVNPQFNFNVELSKRDVKLIYYTFDNYFPKYKGMDNIELRKYPDSFKNLYYKLSVDDSMHSKLLAMMYAFYAFMEELLSFTIEEVKKEKPDLIVLDCLANWGKVAARYCNIPYCYFTTSFMGDEQMVKRSFGFKLNIAKSVIFDFPYLVKILTILNRVKKQYGKLYDMPMDMWSHQNKFTMVMTSREFHPGGDMYPDNVKFVGPAFVEDCIIPDTKDTILISMGTILFSDKFWDTCIEAAKGLGYKVVVTFAGNKKNKVNIKNLPDYVKIYDNMSQEEFRGVLKHSAAFVSHGGFNSICDSIVYRTPLIICPTTVEQVENGGYVQSYGCGLLYNKKNVDVDELREKLVQVVNSESMRANVEKFRQSFLHSMGMEKAVDELVKEFKLS